MKTLINVFHPNLDDSIVNKRWIRELQKYPDQFFVHDVYRTYPDKKININKEQQLIESFDKIVFQFPFYWFNCPPLFKKWLDEVLTHGWAYGKGSTYKLAEKKIALAISAGINEKDFSASGRYKYTLKQLTTPFELTFAYIKADYRSFFAFYGAEHNGTQKRIEKSSQEYIDFIQKF
jgi:putative NADPH-quinone reductase